MMKILPSRSSKEELDGLRDSDWLRHGNTPSQTMTFNSSNYNLQIFPLSKRLNIYTTYIS